VTQITTSGWMNRTSWEQCSIDWPARQSKHRAVLPFPGCWFILDFAAFLIAVSLLATNVPATVQHFWEAERAAEIAVGMRIACRAGVRNLEITMLPEELFKILLAVALGGLIGIEREYRDKTAGFRTMILICVGATLFTILSQELGGAVDSARIAAAIVSGVGFLGAGAILRGPERVVGLTTASTIWVAAALGMGIGGGQYLLALFAALVTFVVLLLFPRIEARIDAEWHSRRYEIVCALRDGLFEELEHEIRDCGLKIRSRKRTKSSAGMECTWTVYGPPKNHDSLVDRLFAHPEVKKFQV
jgi:putative Mg2+ transporter-C (MgtC) family protein